MDEDYGPTVKGVAVQGTNVPATGASRVERCEACGVAADDLVKHEGAFYCPSLHRCDYNQNIGWMNADIQAGIDAEMQR